MVERSETLETLLSEIRYNERLCTRTARLYRKTSAAMTFFGILGGTAVLSALLQKFPPWVSLSGAAVFAAIGALSVSMKPVEKAIGAEADGKRYTQLKARARQMAPAELREALEKLQENDVPEIESLRMVAFNDTVTERGRPEQAVPLSFRQRFVAMLA